MVFIHRPSKHVDFLDRPARGVGALDKISDRGVPPTVSRCSRRLDQFL